MTKFGNRVLCGLPTALLLCSLLPAQVQAQFSQQGPKLVGTGAIGLAGQGSVALSEDGNTAIVGGAGDDSGAGAAWVFINGAESGRF